MNVRKAFRREKGKRPETASMFPGYDVLVKEVIGISD